MGESETKYDVAISFLHRDEALALAIDARLREQFNVFVYSKRQEELAGTNGLESFREAFLTESRLAVVLLPGGMGDYTVYARRTAGNNGSVPNYQASYEWCWHLKSSTEFYAASELAGKLLKTLLNLQDRFERGEIKVESDNDL